MAPGNLFASFQLNALPPRGLTICPLNISSHAIRQSSFVTVYSVIVDQTCDICDHSYTFNDNDFSIGTLWCAFSSDCQSFRAIGFNSYWFLVMVRIPGFHSIVWLRLKNLFPIGLWKYRFIVPTMLTCGFKWNLFLFSSAVNIIYWLIYNVARY